MDAKPQKPLRAIRINDENAFPGVSLPKTLHTRNKSSPALSTMAAAGAMRTAAKRAAFADVSNTSLANRIVKDDLLLPAKSFGLKAKDSLHVLQQTRREQSFAPATFSHPAQRPLRHSSDGSKELPVPAVTHEKAKILVTNASVDRGFELEGVKSEKEIVPLLVVEGLAANPLIIVPTNIVAESSLPNEVAPEEESHPQLQEEPSISMLPSIREPCNTLEAQSIQTQDDHVEHISAPVQAQQLVLKSEPEVLIPYDKIDPELEQDIIEAIKATQISQALSASESGSLPIDPELDPQVVSVEPLATAQEPEEYWDEEEDEENYDDEGFVTARSFRSRDNVTGNATTLLVPRQNQKARKEIAAARVIVESLKTVEDFDDEKFDTSMVAEYGDEIFDYLRHMEAKMQPNPYYMDYQTEIQWSMRSVLMDWIVQVHLRFGLLPETLFLCANYIDRFLSAKVVSLNKLQLVGATALFVAAKYEEINCPSVQEIVYMVDNGYSVDEVLKAERFMLSMLQFELGWPGPMSFLRRISKADDYDLETRTLAKYLLEVTIMDERFLGCPPSYTAAGAHCMARMMLQKGEWSPSHVYYSNYTYVQLIPIINLIFECCEDPQKHHAAIFDKYSDKRYKSSSTFVSNQIRKHNWRPTQYLMDNGPLAGSIYEQLLWAQEYVPVAW